MKKPYYFRLYVLGSRKTPHPLVKNLKAILDDVLKGRYVLRVIDALAHPGLAEKDRILAAPALIKISPPPVKKVVGDLSYKARLLEVLDLVYRDAEKTAGPRVPKTVSLQLAEEEVR